MLIFLYDVALTGHFGPRTHWMYEILHIQAPIVQENVWHLGLHPDPRLGLTSPPYPLSFNWGGVWDGKGEGRRDGVEGKGGM